MNALSRAGVCMIRSCATVMNLSLDPGANTGQTLLGRAAGEAGAEQAGVRMVRTTARPAIQRSRAIAKRCIPRADASFNWT